MNTIPKTIHLVSTSSIPLPKYTSYIDQMRALHPEWEIIIWDEATALAFVDEHFPEWKDHYRAYKIPVQRADIFRIMVVYLRGGFYLDMDMQCLKSLDDLCTHELVLGVEKTLSPGLCMWLHHRYPVRIANYMFGSRPNHGFWLDFLAAAKDAADVVISYESEVLDTTGPGLLTNVYHQTRLKYDDITVLPNDTRACLRSCGPASCHFGDYAAHLHMGSWRWLSITNS